METTETKEHLTVHSEKYQGDIELTGDAALLYTYIKTTVGTRNCRVDPAYCDELIKMGYDYNYETRQLFSAYDPVYIGFLVDNEIMPAVANYASELLTINMSTYPTSDWVYQALPHVNVDTAQKLQNAGWPKDYAIIIAAFPEREARLKESIEKGIHYYNDLVQSDYNVPMLARLSNLRGNDSRIIIEVLDKGYTEKEIKDYGFMLTRHFNPEELRASKIRPSWMKNVFSAFTNSLHITTSQKYYNQELTEYIPTISELERLVMAGIRTAKQYKAGAKMIGMDAYTPTYVLMVTIALGHISYETLTTLYAKLGVFNVTDAPLVAQALNMGRTLEEYCDVMEEIKAEEEKRRLAHPNASKALEFLTRENTPKEAK